MRRIIEGLWTGQRAETQKKYIQALTPQGVTMNSGTLCSNSGVLVVVATACRALVVVVAMLRLQLLQNQTLLRYGDRVVMCYISAQTQTEVQKAVRMDVCLCGAVS